MTGNDENVGSMGTVPEKSEGVKCLVDSIVRNLGADKSNMRVECFPGIRADQLCRVMENRNLGRTDTVIIHVGTNDVRRTRNLDCIMGEVYNLVTTAKEKFPGSRLVLSGVLRNKGVKWRWIRTTNNRLEWVVSRLGATFVDPNKWIRDADFGRDGLHLNRYGTGQPGDLYSRISGLDGQSQAV
jgi:hypothetical protein